MQLIFLSVLVWFFVYYISFAVRCVARGEYLGTVAGDLFYFEYRKFSDTRLYGLGLLNKRRGKRKTYF